MIIFVSNSLTKVLKKMYRVRLAEEEDSSIIIEFQIKMARESEGLDLDREILSSGVLSVFHDLNKGKYYVVEDGGQIVASMLNTYEWSDWRNQWVIWLQSVYIIPEHRRKGIFRLMYEHVQQLAKNDEGIAGIRLYVDSTNQKALNAYSSVGMDGEHYKVFEWMEEE
jgi:GNAT superfamily N-acetyltransferase